MIHANFLSVVMKTKKIKVNILNKNHPVGNRLKEMFDLANKGLCPFCGEKPKGFKDALSRKEYQISGLCQDCQDNFFKP